ncbi:MAG: hypothetical protein H6867_07090 [Rhodospirillales bacterium]|nr:hypothetical protein [Rhodospirillales bacterium]MCB9995315.1 hypothetical protein [Rhodospirillales bacterium]
MSATQEGHKPRTIAVLMEQDGSTRALLERLHETFNRTARIITIDSNDIRFRNALDDIDVLFIPGVKRTSQHYRHRLGYEGGVKIKNWVKNGGTAVGLCQGAYLLTKTFKYTDKHNNKAVRTIHPSTGIFEGTAYGPVEDYIDWEERENPFIDYNVARLEFNDAARGAACYDHGPWLKLSDSAEAEEYNIIARFSDIKDKPIAIASRRYGKGKAIFSGVLPEITGHAMASIDEDSIPKHTPNRHHFTTGIRFAKKLAAHEEQRQLVWNRLMAEIK